MDKDLLYISGLLAIIAGILYSFTVIGVVFGLPLIIGGVVFTGYAKLSDEHIENEKGKILGWSIFFLITCVLPGILGLIYYLSIANLFNTKEDYIEELKSLKKLEKEGIITNAEFEKQKKRILNQ